MWQILVTTGQCLSSSRASAAVENISIPEAIYKRARAYIYWFSTYSFLKWFALVFSSEILEFLTLTFPLWVQICQVSKDGKLIPCLPSSIWAGQGKDHLALHLVAGLETGGMRWASCVTKCADVYTAVNKSILCSSLKIDVVLLCGTQHTLVTQG